MNPPRTPGRSAKQISEQVGSAQSGTSAASPFTSTDQDSPRYRASTMAYGSRNRAYSPSARSFSPSSMASPDLQSSSRPTTPRSASSTKSRLAPPLRTADYDSFAQPQPQTKYPPHNNPFLPVTRLQQSPQQQSHQQPAAAAAAAAGSVSASSSSYTPSSPPTPRAPSAPRRLGSADSIGLGPNGSESALVVPRTPSRSTQRGASANSAPHGASYGSANGLAQGSSYGSSHGSAHGAHPSIGSAPAHHQRTSSAASAHHQRTSSAASAHHQRTPSASAHARATMNNRAAVPAGGTGVGHSRKVQKRTSIGPWEFVKSIGAGSMGQVKLAVHRYTRQPAAVKIVPKAFTQRSKDGRESNESKDARVIREAAIGRLLNHPNISKLYDVYSMTGHFYLVFEYISGGQMLDYIIAHGCVKEVQARRFARSICSALDYCHQNSIVHRDLKIENILIADNGDVKLIDFGLSNMFRRTDLLRTFCGSLYFAAPELLNALPYTGPEIDVWSFGVVLYVLVCGKVPFEDKSMTALHSKIKRGTVEYPSWLSAHCVDLLRRMLTVNPESRASLQEVCNHPWMLKGYDAPPDSLTPRRIPLTVDTLDPLVIDEMEKLGVGEAGQIELSLRQVLSSEDYHLAVDLWYDSQQIDLAVPASAKNTYGYSSPVNSFSPEISCYFLTRERMESTPSQFQQQQQLQQQQQQQQYLQQQVQQQQLQQQQQYQQYQQQLQHSHHYNQQQVHQPFQGLNSVQTPSIAIVPASQHTNESSELKVGRTRARTIGSEFRDQALPASPADAEQNQGALQVPQPAFVSNVMQQAQVGVVTPVSAVKSIEITPHGTMQVPDDKPHRIVSQPLPSRLSSDSSDSSTYSQSSGKNENSAQTPQVTHVVQTPHQQNQQALQQFQTHQPQQQPLSLFRKFSLRKSKPGHVRAKSTNHAHDIQSKPFEEVPPNGMPSIESPKQVFFRGIFSVQTTSTKPLREIREEILRVLSLKHIEYVEVKGGFACVARPNYIRRQASLSSGNASTGSATDDPLRTPSRFADQSLNSMGLSPSTPPSTPRTQHRRKVSENGVLSPIGSIGGSLESIDMEIGASDMLGNESTQKSSIPVRFEIDIVRVPIVSLHGIQFKKMTGNVWLYKNLAQEIIEELRI